MSAAIEAWLGTLRSLPEVQSWRIGYTAISDLVSVEITSLAPPSGWEDLKGGMVTWSLLDESYYDVSYDLRGTPIKGPFYAKWTLSFMYGRSK